MSADLEGVQCTKVANQCTGSPVEEGAISYSRARDEVTAVACVNVLPSFDITKGGCIPRTGLNAELCYERSQLCCMHQDKLFCLLGRYRVKLREPMWPKQAGKRRVAFELQSQ